MKRAEIKIELFPLAFSANIFHIKKFFSNLISSDDPIYDSNISALQRLDMLKITITKQHSVRRHLCTTILQVTDELKLKVNLYAPFKRSPKPSIVNTDRDTNKHLPFYMQYSTPNFEPIKPTELTRVCAVSQDMVELPVGEVDTIKSWAHQGITLVGFKPRTELKSYYNITSALFLSSNDDTKDDTSQLIDALVRTLIIEGKIAIGKIRLADRCIQRNIAFLPQLGKRGADSCFLFTGFYLVYLPYQDELKTITELPFVSINSEQTYAANEVISSLMLQTFDPYLFENPTISTLFSNLQQIALGQPLLDKVEDLLNPNQAMLQAGIDSFLHFNKVFSLGEENILINSNKTIEIKSNSDTIELNKRSAKKQKRKKNVKTVEVSKNEEKESMFTTLPSSPKDL